MRKSLLFVLFLCMHHIIRGQNTYHYEYWFDNDRTTLQTGTSTTNAWQMDVDLTDLNNSFHTVHLQVKDDEGVLSSPVSRHFVKMAPSASQMKGYYWFDNDQSTMKTSDVINGTFDVDVSMLSEGYHTFHYQAIDNLGSASSVVTSLIYKEFQTGNLATFRCWFDNNYSTMQDGFPVDDVAVLDVSALSDGFHVVHVQADGIASTSPHSYYFIKQPQTKGVEYITLVCSIDGVLYKQERVSNTGGAMLWDFDISDLKQGLHHIQLLGVTPSGAATSSYTTFFIRATTQEEIEDMKFYYYIDNDNFTVYEGRYENGGFHFDLDVSQLSDGLHRLAYFMSNGKGITTTVTSQFFWKTPVGGNGIMEYKYWLNDKSSEEDIQVVKLAERTNPYQLITLLPVESQPLRSSCFEFRMRNGLPIIYAKNDIHIRFTEATGRFTDVSKQFVDESVSQEVEPVGELQETQTFDRVAENGIRWYTINLEEGDSVAFKSSQACTILLFAPSGEEVYSASGSQSVTMDGCHAWEEGTYYLAVHDVMGSQSRMTLEYMHMDKYDVVGQDVWAVGNGGCSTITFSGNGFKDLGSVELYNSLGDKINSLDVGHESDASTSVTFDFTGAELGEYSAVFHFSEEDKDFSNILTVEEPVDIELATTVTYPSVFLRGSSTTYTIKIENKGNMTAYAVPIEMHLFTDKMDDVTEIKFDGYMNDINHSDIVLDEDCDEDAIEILKECIRNSKGLSQFVVYHDSIANKDFALSYALLTLPPNATKQFTISIKSNSTITLEAYTNKEWFPLFVTNRVVMGKMRRASARESMCCMRKKVECVGGVIANVAGAALPPGANCVTSFSKTGLETLYDVWCSEGSNMSDRFDNYLKSEGQNLANKLIESAVSCVMGYYGKWLKELRKDRALAASIGNTTEVARLTSQIQNVRGALNGALNAIYKGISTMVLGEECYDAFTKSIPNCPPNPGGGGGSSTPVNSLDPNDIYGYTSESGSKYISKDVQKVNYTIEFENDPEFATASAHTVVVKDVLDKNLFDLASYKPTAIKIGDKIVDLNGDQTFVTTVDMRPAIDAIAQVDGMLDSKTGTVTWSFTSLDPMSMEPSYHVMQGFLPVNADGNGIGEVMFDINLKQQFPDGTEIPNQASIVFDTNEAILTPVWTNTIDAVAPTSHVSACEIKNDTTATLHFESEDNLSGVWKYDVYVQYEENASWTKVAEGVTEPECDVRIYEGINHGFYVVATDSAGNVEMKEAAREYTLDLFEPTEDSDLELELAEGWNWVSHNLNTSVDVADVQTHAKRILGQEEETIKDAAFGFVGDLTELKPTLGYKILVDADDNVALDGKLYNASYKSIGLSEGWNWIGYPLAHEMEIAQALENFTPEEGDYIIGQDDFTQYADGEWVGTLSTLTPGLGYLYKSGATKQMFFNSTATLSSRAEAQRRVAAIESPWSCDKHKYPNVMAVTACLYNNEMAEDAGDYYVAAFCDNECRGVGKTVKGLVMMNVYGQGNETIQFKVIDKETEQLMDIAENVAFNADVQGSIAAPFRMTIGDGLTTDIANRSDLQIKITPAVIRNTMTVEIGAERIDRLTVTSMNGAVVANWKKLANGSTVDVSSLTAGVYVVTVKAGKQVFTKKVMKVTE